MVRLVGYIGESRAICLLLSPLVLTTDLILFLGREVVLDVEGLADLFWGLALDHVGDGLAADVEESFDVKIVGSLRRMIRLETQATQCSQPTKMISNSISWSTCMNFWSHSSISVVFLRESASSSFAAGGSPLW